ncbi:Uncharacterised protein [Vibrio cholerae]|nr:Uncharacterised protein [Vibrio cholerae]
MFNTAQGLFTLTIEEFPSIRERKAACGTDDKSDAHAVFQLAQLA